jgi:hypothetical protein
MKENVLAKITRLKAENENRTRREKEILKDKVVKSQTSSLNSKYSNLNDKELNDLCELLKNDQFFKELSLNNCLKLTDTSFELIGEMLKVNNSLQKLSILDCKQLADKGYLFISEGLKHNKSLKEIFITESQIEDPQLKITNEILKTNRGLKKFSVKFYEDLENYIYDENTDDSSDEQNQHEFRIVEKTLASNYFLSFFEFGKTTKSVKKLITRNSNLDRIFEKNFKDVKTEEIEDMVKFYHNNFFRFTGVCPNKIKADLPTNETGIYNLPKVVIGYIATFIPIEDAINIGLSGNVTTPTDEDVSNIN